MRLRAVARTLRGTSGPWIELKMDHHETIAARMDVRSAGCAPRGRWASIRVASLGRESHPLSVASVSAAAPGSFSAIVSANSGDWSRALAALASRHDDDENMGGNSSSSGTECDVEVSGPYPVGGGGWSLPYARARVTRRSSPRVLDPKERQQENERLPEGEPAPALLLIAGGTGITGWLPAMEAAASAASASAGSGSGCRLMWCVKTEADYLALASRLPRGATSKKGSNTRIMGYNGVDVSVFITRGDKTAPEAVAVDRKGGERDGDIHHRAVEEKEMDIGKMMASAKSPTPPADADGYVGCDGDSCASSAFDAAPLVSLGVALIDELWRGNTRDRGLVRPCSCSVARFPDCDYHLGPRFRFHFIFFYHNFFLPPSHPLLPLPLLLPHPQAWSSNTGSGRAGS